ncbi:MAG: hypothetical protein KAV42_00245 [Candidatus Krumholzibacteria bacterium]|nr:hypothetical protein [Candidatus Krumholzibacteria bacterium]
MEPRKRHKFSRLLAAVLLAVLVILSCGDKETIVEVPVEVPADCPPSPPRDVYAINLAGFVSICWAPNPEEDVQYYDIYRSVHIDSLFKRIGYVEDNHPDDDPWEYCYDDDTINYGQQFFYSVVAVDYDGYESTDLADGYLTDIVSATPRYEGLLTLSDSNTDPSTSGYNFSPCTNIAQPFDDADTDLYFSVNGSARFIVDSPRVRIQDYGFVDYEAYGFDAINYAPAEGWSPSGTAEVIEGHMYFLRIGEEIEEAHYVKLWINDVTSVWTQFLWAYQSAAGNRDLMPGTLTGEDGSSDEKPDAGTRALTDGMIKTKRVRRGRQIPQTSEGNLNVEENL